jgi:hypothetical protein
MEQNRPTVRETPSKVRGIKAEAEVWSPRLGSVENYVQIFK